ncbi:MAG TPA: YkvA family protein [Noviherbaspirillum sp.]|nr:YkvA family protein [Noviherbaspirillum sp.]
MSFRENVRAWARRLKRDGLTLWFACRHPGTPFLAKMLCMGIVAYALSPIDLIPDFIPVLGYVDEVLLLPALIWLAIRMVPDAVLQECRRQSDEWMVREGKKPRSMWGAVIVVCIWIGITWAAWKYLAEPAL